MRWPDFSRKKVFLAAGEDLKTWSTPKLTEVMALLVDQLARPDGSKRQRASMQQQLDDITAEIRRRNLG